MRSATSLSLGNPYISQTLAEPPQYPAADHSSGPVEEVPPNTAIEKSSAEDQRQTEHLADNERDLAHTEINVPPIGIPLPGAISNLSVPPPVTSTSTSVAPTLHATSSISSSNDIPINPKLQGEDAKVAAQLAAKQKEEGSSADGMSEKQSELPKKKGLSFMKRKKAKDAAEKKGKGKEDEMNSLPPVSVFALFRFATPFEVFLNFLGLFLAAAAGATQPLMTLIFGRLTNSFNEFGIIQGQIAQEGFTAANIQALYDAQAALRRDSGNNALYLMAIGLGMFVCTCEYRFEYF